MIAPLDMPAQDEVGSRRQRPRVHVRVIAGAPGERKDNSEIKDFVRQLARQAAAEYASRQTK